MEEPTLYEMIRSLQADVRRLLADQALYVTQEQRASDKEVMDLKLAAVAADQKEDRARLDNMGRLLWSAVLGPVIVGIILYVLIGKGP